MFVRFVKSPHASHLYDFVLYAVRIHAMQSRSWTLWRIYVETFCAWQVFKSDSTVSQDETKGKRVTLLGVRLE